MRAGAKYTFRPTTSAQAASAAKRKHPTARRVDVEAARAALDAAELPRIAAKQGPLDAARLRSRVEAGTQVRTSIGSDDATFVEPTLAVVVDVPLFVPGLSAGVAARLLGEALAPKDRRFRPGDLVELDVTRASVAYASPDGVWRAEGGRFFPEAPGAPLVDGIEASFAVLPSLRVGLLGGAVPSLTTLAPALDRLEGDAFASWRWSPVVVDAMRAAGGPEADAAARAGDAFGDLRVGALVVGADARVGVAGGAAGFRVEAEARSTVALGALVGTSAGAALALDPTAGLSLSRAFVEARLSPLAALRVDAAYRWQGQASPDFDALDLAVGPVRAAHRIDGDIEWDVGGHVTVGASAGTAIDPAGGIRSLVGPTAAWRASPATRIALAYLEELGDFSGRSARFEVEQALFADATLRSSAWYAETAQVGVDPLRELGASTAVRWALLSWLSTTARIAALQPLPALDGSPRALPTTLVGDVALRVQF